jgi:hypothetical protein
VHLRVADLLGDLRLGHVLDEAQAEDQPFAVVELRQHAFERQFVVDQLVALVLVADPLRGGRFVIFTADRAVERERPAVVVRLQHFEHFGRFDFQFRRDLADRGRALQLDRQRRRRFLHFGHPVVQPAWHPHGPDAVAEVALQFAEDGGGGEGGEGRAADRVEAVDRVDQAEVRHLQQVVEGL